MKAFSINDRFIHFHLDRADKSKPTLVFANSLGTDFRIWDKVRNDLSGHCTMLFHDKRGHGLSTLGSAPNTIETFAADLAALMDHLGLKQSTAIGLSVGGLVVQGLFHARPDLVSKLVVCNSAVRLGSIDSWTGRINAVKAGGLDSIADTIMKVWYSPAFHATAPDQVMLSRTMMARCDETGYLACCEALRDCDFTAKAADIKVPTLFVGGEFDGSVPPEVVEKSAALVPGARFALIKSCAHIPCVEQPAALVDLLRGFALASR